MKPTSYKIGNLYEDNFKHTFDYDKRQSMFIFSCRKKLENDGTRQKVFIAHLKISPLQKMLTFHSANKNRPAHVIHTPCSYPTVPPLMTQ